MKNRSPRTIPVKTCQFLLSSGLIEVSKNHQFYISMSPLVQPVISSKAMNFVISWRSIEKVVSRTIFFVIFKDQVIDSSRCILRQHCRHLTFARCWKLALNGLARCFAFRRTFIKALPQLSRWYRFTDFRTVSRMSIYFAHFITLIFQGCF